MKSFHCSSTPVSLSRKHLPPQEVVWCGEPGRGKEGERQMKKLGWHTLPEYFPWTSVCTTPHANSNFQFLCSIFPLRPSFVLIFSSFVSSPSIPLFYTLCLSHSIPALPFIQCRRTREPLASWYLPSWFSFQSFRLIGVSIELSRHDT